MTRLRLGAGIVALVLIAIVVGVYFAGRAHATAAAAPADRAATTASVPNVPLYTVRDGTFVERLGAQGRVGPPAGSSANVAFAQPGIVATVDVRPGERVTAGTRLASLDRAALGAAVAQAQADAAAAASGYGGGAVPQSALASARARLTLAQTKLHALERSGAAATSDLLAAQSAARQASLKVSADTSALERAQTLVAGGVAPAKDVEAARAQLEGDRAEARAARARLALASGNRNGALEQARADAAMAQNDVTAANAQGGNLGAQANSARARLLAARIAYDRGVLYAPADGTVLRVLKHPGEAVDTTVPVIEIGPADVREATLVVPADRASRVHAGDPVEFTATTGTAASRGSVITVIPAVDPNAQTATIVARGVPAESIPGDALAASIVVANRRGLVVPASALVQDPQTGDTVVFVVKNDAKGRSFDQRTVRVGASDERTATIASGLRAGERIAARGGYELLAPPG